MYVYEVYECDIIIQAICYTAHYLDILTLLDHPGMRYYPQIIIAEKYIIMNPHVDKHIKCNSTILLSSLPHC